MGSRSSDERREKRKKFISLFIFHFTTWFNLQLFLSERSWPDIPMYRRVLGSLISALVFASAMSWYTVYYYPRYREKCLERMRRRLERKIAMGKKPSKWDKLLEKILCEF